MSEKNTRVKIFDSLVKLSEEKAMSKLSIAEITRNAKLTRGSFYNHSIDLEDAILALENERLQELENIINGTRAIHGADENEKEFYKRILTEIDLHKKDYQQLLSPNGDA
ncbi:hypothetical protein LNP00_01520 [Fructobacillus sp. M158]|uniref:TetR/AcrR family transcriptional regulator n=1 Tax=Fructobacillus parabroussonetiae TaxID=2713174 RepID=UPI00200B4D78|nr:hypothetical protein [Fructobacillus parabroussonetiae]MCK8617050.1 hypothetical protein [Fructobacillus parabroussonetiae]